MSFTLDRVSGVPEKSSQPEAGPKEPMTQEDQARLDKKYSVEKSEPAPFGKQYGFPEEAPQFPGTKIVSFEQDGKIKRYALSRDSSGTLQGVEFELQEKKVVSGTGGSSFWENSPSLVKAESTDGERYRIGVTYQMHGDALDSMEKFLNEKGVVI